MAFAGSSLWEVRQKWGSGLLVWAGVTLVVVNEEDEVLLGHRTDFDAWTVLGGHFEVGDSADSCARRELEEETGLKAETVTMFGVITDPQRTTVRYPNGHEVQAPTFVLEVRVVKAPLAADEEHDAFEWVSVDEARARVAANPGVSPFALEMFCAWRAGGEFQVA
jgi:8-oxo-dGTP pyrophosphatase MutT (NUDIX family)